MVRRHFPGAVVGDGGDVFSARNRNKEKNQAKILVYDKKN